MLQRIYLIFQTCGRCIRAIFVMIRGHCASNKPSDLFRFRFVFKARFVNCGMISCEFCYWNATGFKTNRLRTCATFTYSKRCQISADISDMFLNLSHVLSNCDIIKATFYWALLVGVNCDTFFLELTRVLNDNVNITWTV